MYNVRHFALQCTVPLISAHKSLDSVHPIYLVSQKPMPANSSASQTDADADADIVLGSPNHLLLESVSQVRWGLV